MVTAVARGRAMILWPWAAAALAVACALALPGASAIATHVVGDGTGWTVPSSTSFYADWASKQTVAVGDTLVFNFTTGTHNVIRVPKSSYDACNAQNQIGGIITTGPASVALNSTGVNYYICGIGQHCSLGQKVAITVASSVASPSPAPTAGGPLPPTSSTPSMPAPSGPAPSSATQSSPAVSALRVAAGFAVAALAAGACLI